MSTGSQLPTRGIVHGLHHEAYHAHPAISKSGLDRLAVSPAHLRSYLAGERKETEALRFGRLCHLAILEPDRFAVSVAVAPKIDRRTKAGKSEWDGFCQLNIGCEIVTDEDMNTLRRIQDSVRSHKTAGQLLSFNGRAEVSVFWTDAETGIACRARPDWELGGGVIVDLKSAQDASPKVFPLSMAKHRYHVQEAFYLDGVCEAGGHADTFLFLAFEKEPPFAVCVHQLQPEDREIGRMLYRRDLETLRRCRESDYWPGYPDDIVQTTLPAWARKEASL